MAVAKVDSEGNVTGTRVTLDMRWVNKCVLRDHFPLRRLEDLLSRFGRFKVYSGVDLYDGFTQLPLHPDSQDLSAIVTPWGVYIWTVLPQGLANFRLPELMIMSPFYGPRYLTALALAYPSTY